MQCFNHWPDINKLALPEAVAQDFYQHLLMPFNNKSAAKEFWDEMPSTIIILNDFDSIERIKQCVIWEQVEFALTYPEYTETLKEDYQVLLAIVNDSGCGIYLVIPPELSQLNAQKDLFTHSN